MQLYPTTPCERDPDCCMAAQTLEAVLQTGVSCTSWISGSWRGGASMQHTRPCMVENMRPNFNKPSCFNATSSGLCLQSNSCSWQKIMIVATCYANRAEEYVMLKRCECHANMIYVWITWYIVMPWSNIHAFKIWILFAWYYEYIMLSIMYVMLTWYMSCSHDILC